MFSIGKYSAFGCAALALLLGNWPLLAAAQNPPRYYPKDNMPAITPYEVSSEFPVKRSNEIPSSAGIQQGYTPSVGVNGMLPEGGAAPAFDPYSAQAPIDPNTGEPAVGAESAPAVVVAKPDVEERYKEVFAKKAVLLFTDKVSAKSEEKTVDVPSQVSYRDLVVQIEKCHIASDIVDAEHAALLEIYTSDAAQASGAAGERQFAGWMFRMRRSLTSLQSAYYDVSLVKCVSEAPRVKVYVEDGKEVEKPMESSEKPDKATGDERAKEQPVLPDGVKAKEAPSSAASTELSPEQAADKAVESVNKLLGEDAAASQETQDIPSSD